MMPASFAHLSQDIQNKIEKQHQEAEMAPRIAKISLSLLATPGAALAMSAPVVATSVVSLSALSGPVGITILLLVALASICSLIYNILQFSQQDDLGRMNALRSMISSKLEDNQYVEMEINDTIYCIDQAGVTEKDSFDTRGKTCVEVERLLQRK